MENGIEVERFQTKLVFVILQKSGGWIGAQLELPRQSEVAFKGASLCYFGQSSLQFLQKKRGMQILKGVY